MSLTTLVWVGFCAAVYYGAGQLLMTLCGMWTVFDLVRRGRSPEHIQELARDPQIRSEIVERVETNHWLLRWSRRHTDCACVQWAWLSEMPPFEAPDGSKWQLPVVSCPRFSRPWRRCRAWRIINATRWVHWVWPLWLYDWAVAMYRQFDELTEPWSRR